MPSNNYSFEAGCVMVRIINNHNMIKNNFLNIISTVFFVLLSVSLNFASSIKEEVIAVIGDQKIKSISFVERYQDYLLVSDMKDNIRVRNAILNNMINEVLLRNFDDNSKIFNNNEYIKEVEWNKKQAILSYLKDRDVYAKIDVTEEELKEAFLKVNEKIAARHLYTANEKEAYELYDLLKIGRSFEDLAKTVFTDSLLRNNGGYLGYFTWGDMDPAFEEAAYSLKIGEISEPVKTAYGYSIIKLEDKVRAPLLTENEFLNKKSHLTRTLKIRKKKPAERAYIISIYNKDDFKVNVEILNELLDDLFPGNKLNIDFEKKYSENNTCVTYKNKKHSISAIKEKLLTIPTYHLSRINSVENLTAAIESIFIQDELYKKAEAKGYNTLHTVIDMISKLQNNSFLKFKKNEILDNASISDSLVKNYYKNNINLFNSPKMIDIQEILVHDKSAADSLIVLINNGEDFGKLARDNSLRKWTADNNGIFGLTPLDKFGMLKDKFWGREENSVIGPIQIENVYGVFKILQKVESKPIEFERIINKVEQKTKEEYEVKILTDYLDILRSKVKIYINEEFINSYQSQEAYLK